MGIFESDYCMIGVLIGLYAALFGSVVIGSRLSLKKPSEQPLKHKSQIERILGQYDTNIQDGKLDKVELDNLLDKLGDFPDYQLKGEQK